jgi:hypothetical protein
MPKYYLKRTTIEKHVEFVCVRAVSEEEAFRCANDEDTWVEDKDDEFIEMLHAEDWEIWARPLKKED